MNTKAKGSRNERKTRDWYLKNGATFVIKAGASLGMYDLVVFFPDHVDMVQVKSNKWPSPEERTAMIRPINRLPDCCRFVCIRWKDYARKPEVRYL
jgi:hypothetical protein